MRTPHYKLHAPKCAHPDCNTPVHYHSRYLKEDGSPGFKWKVFCEYHRKKGRKSMQAIKENAGCANVSGKYKFVCTSVIHDPSQIQVHHIDGNKHNNNVENLEFLCANCHSLVTKLMGDNLTRYDYTNPMFDQFFELT